MSIDEWLKMKAATAPEWANWIASLHPNTWYYCEYHTQVEATAVRHYRLAGVHEGEYNQWFELEDLK